MSSTHRQSTEIRWEQYTEENLKEAERIRKLSIELRGTLDAILMNSARDLRTQADSVDRAMHNRIICMDEMRQRLENELRTVSRSNVFALLVNSTVLISVPPTTG